MNLRRTSFIIFFTTFILAAYFSLATPLLTVLFSYFALTRLEFFGKKWVSVSLFLILVSGIFYGFSVLEKEAITTIPKVAETSIPIALHQATKWGIELPFSDLDSLKAVAVQGIKNELRDVAKITFLVTKELVLVIIGLVVGVSIYLNSKIDLGQNTYAITNNLYSLLTDEVGNRFYNFYMSFSKVIGAQLIISTINTLFTAIFVFGTGIPHAHIVLVVTFLCGLLPIIGNILSNTFICGVALTQSPQLAIYALLFLVAVHKVEYFLNSKIIGSRIKNPMWLTLLSLIVGERVMGIPGMILAPVLLNYLKLEGSAIEVEKPLIVVE